MQRIAIPARRRYTFPAVYARMSAPSEAGVRLEDVVVCREMKSEGAEKAAFQPKTLEGVVSR